MAPSRPSPSAQRVRITWKEDSESVPQELPFVIGVLADLTGNPEQPLPRLKYRRFITVDVATLDEVIEACSPRLAFRVENTLLGDASRLYVALRIRRLDDFRPENVARHIEPLRKLLEMREHLAELRNRLLVEGELREYLLEVLSNNEKMIRLKHELDSERERLTVEPLRQNAPTSHNQPLGALEKRAAEPATLREQGVWTSRRTIVEESSILEESPVLEEIVETGRSIRNVDERDSTRDLVKAFLEVVLEGEIQVSSDVEAMINARVSAIDEIVSQQLTEVLHHPEFMRLEAAWRGIHYLSRSTRKAAGVKIKVLDVSKQELSRQFQRARGSHDPQITRQVLNQAAGTLGAEPFGLLIGDYEIDHHPSDVELLEGMAQMGTVAHVPFIATAAPSLFGLTSFADLLNISQPGSVFEGIQYARWHSFRAREESRYVGLALPRVLLRRPYGEHGTAVKDFSYEECTGKDKATFLWGSAVWAFAVHVAADFDGYGWFGAARDAGQPPGVPDLPVHTCAADDGITVVGPTEVSISDACYLELRSLGLIPLSRIEGLSRIMFFEAWSCHKPKVDPEGEPPTTQESAEIDCVLTVSRIAHYLRCIVREYRQCFSSVQACEEYLYKWIAPYIVPEYAKGSSYALGFPLLEAQFRILPHTEAESLGLLKASIVPQRAVGALNHPVEISIQVPLPQALALVVVEERANNSRQDSSHTLDLAPTAAHTPPPQLPKLGISRRDQFIRRLFLAESSIADHKLEAATFILEDLAEQIDRHHLEEWESPQLVCQVWDLLRRCYHIASPLSSDKRSVELLRRICRLDPVRAIE